MKRCVLLILVILTPLTAPPVLTQKIVKESTLSEGKERKYYLFAEGEQEKRVREFVEAFNARKLDVMLELAAENIQWMHIDGAKVSIEAEGKAALRESMERYFKSCSSCRSSLEWVQIAGSRVTAMERASWTGKGGAKSQRSLSVYEFRGDKILRVYYFPAEADTLPQS